MAGPALTAVAVDWTGVRERQTQKLWLAAVRGGRLVALERGRTRAELVAHLADWAAHDPGLVVGLGFAFAFPRWFGASHGAGGPEALWELARRCGERWLADCPPPFWGLPGRPRPRADPRRPSFRRTELARPPLAGITPKSVFQVGGHGSVGAATLRGLPFLPALRAAGFALLPFDVPRLPVVLEVYPRYLTGVVNKSSRAARMLHVAQHLPALEHAAWRAASSSEDAFDALLAAHSLADHLEHVLACPPPDRTERLEGRIWWPPVEPFLPASWPALRHERER